MQTIISAIGVFIATSIDYFFILVILFAQLQNKKQKKHIYAGQYLGTAILVSASLIAAYILNFVPEEWIIGLLGLIPIYLGIRFAVVEGDEDAAEEEIKEKIKGGKTSRLFWVVTLLTLSAGGDNLAIYVPYFTSLSWTGILIVVLVFVIGVLVLCEASRALSSVPLISETVEKYERIIVPVVFILLGVYILIENGTLQHMWSMIS